MLLKLYPIHVLVKQEYFRYHEIDVLSFAIDGTILMIYQSVNLLQSFYKCVIVCMLLEFLISPC